MPPISVEVTVTQTGELKRFPDAQPDSLPVALEDGGGVIVVTCNHNDNGGVVARYEKAEAEKLMSSKGVGSSEAVVEIGDSQTHSMPIESKYGHATLTLTHCHEED